MTAYIPYLVVLAVVIVFFFVCYLVFRDKDEPTAKRLAARETVANADYYERKRAEHGGTQYRTRNVTAEDTATRRNGEAAKTNAEAPTQEAMEATQIMPASHRDTHARHHSEQAAAKVEEREWRRKHSKAKRDEADAQARRHTVKGHRTAEQTVPNSSVNTDATVVIGSREELARHLADTDNVTRTQTPTAPADTDMTRPIAPINVRTMEASEVADDATRILPVVTAETTPAAKRAASHSDVPAAGDAVDWAVHHFMQSFGMLGDSAKEGVRAITADALQRLGITGEAEVKALLENIVVQEALMCMQKAYVATPTPWMYETAIEAFGDVVQQPKSSTLYLLAFDALRILPHLHLGHFQVMALALLLQYSRNSNNYSMDNLRHYVEKYIEPFVSDVPRDESMHRQLEYLHCSAQATDRVSLAAIFSNSYPLIFKYRGFTRDELSMALDGERLDERFIARSINSSMYKLTLVDEGLAQRFFRLAHISDGDIQQRLLALAKSKPTAFTGRESLEIMERISPVLVNLAEVYDTTPISKMTLTLLGLYLGRAHVKVTIGEEFDLSPWL
ncbi:LPO_1073/Vpar_1526 family protein [Veillonella magna]|uniref:LPO_1073/Vpar_1526 family protein n=1 Tax=Veillonella magna TaxID=464322 RepID=UPI0023F1BF05|nr:LPO_1073/Vpar_1526 family protein [Veillonella magna]